MRLYVCSKPIMDNKGELHRHLIGTLSLLENKEYQFSYNLDDDSPICRNLVLSSFPDIHKIYGNAETRTLLDDYLPSENDTAFIAEILKKTGMDYYDEWNWLLTFDADSDADTETCLFETLPDDVIRHDLNFDETKHCENDICDEPAVEDNNTDEFDDDSEYDISDDSEFDTTDDTELLELADEFSNEKQNVESNIDDATVAEIDKLDSDSHIIENAKHINQINKATASHTVIVKKIYKHKKVSTNNDFISPPPENPIEIIQQRLLENQQQRQKQLAEKLKTNPYNTE